MSHSLPSPPSSPAPSPRNHHRSTTASFSFFRPPSPPLPNRSPPSRRAQFSIKSSDDEDEDDEDDEDDEEGDEEEDIQESSSSSLPDTVENAQQVTKLVRGLGLSFSPIPFSPVPFPQLPASRSPSPPSSSPLPKVASHPIILSNGKPLKPSLKSASSSHIPDELKPTHLRATSAPSTPITQPKNVHFRDGSLESVRLFNKAGRPAHLNYSSGNEETETEGETDSNSLPFPIIPERRIYALAKHPHSSDIPPSNPSLAANVHLESISLPPSRPPLLRGSVLVRNLTFHKVVAVRFTLDDWQTTSEIIAHYVTSLPSLPPSLSPTHNLGEASDWSWATSATASALWDRFTFSIKLEDFERSILERTMHLAVRYQAQGPNGGEWWDNNDGRNFKLSFRLHDARPPEKTRSSSAYKSKINEMFNIPSIPPPFDRNKMARPGPPLRSLSNPTVPTYLTLAQMNKAPKSRLRLSNYIAPSPTQDDDDGDEEDSNKHPLGLGKSSITPSDFTAIPPISIIGGMPATAPAAPSKPFELPTPTASPAVSPTSSAIFSNGSQTSPSSPPSDTYSQFVKKYCFHQSSPPIGAHNVPSYPAKEPWQNPYRDQGTMLMSL